MGAAGTAETSIVGTGKTGEWVRQKQVQKVRQEWALQVWQEQASLRLLQLLAPQKSLQTGRQAYR